MSDFVGGERGRALRVELTQRHSQRSPEEIEDAVQSACERFVEMATEITEPGQVYRWIRTTGHRVLNELDERRTREIAVDPIEGVLERAAASDPDPAEEVITQEHDREMEALVREVTDSLSERRREILALHLAGLHRAEIGERLGLSVRAVERELLKIMDDARGVLAQQEGGGCMFGEPMVLRLVYGLASSAEAAQARVHLDRCHRCGGLIERLIEWREKAAVVLPAAPAIEGATGGTFEQVGQKVADAVEAARQQVLGIGVHAKQQAAATYYRAVDPTPLAGVKPSAVAAVLASCVTIGGGAAAYCANQDVDPIGAATGLIGGGSDEPAEAAVVADWLGASELDPAELRGESAG